MLPTRTPPSTNGYHPAPPATPSGAVLSPGAAPSASARRPTVFPPDLERFSPALLLYLLGRGQLGGLTLLRWLWTVGLLLALVWLTGLLPGGLWVSAALLLALLAVTAARILLARRHFVRFVPLPAPAVEPIVLPPPEKLPIHVTGPLEVNGRVRPFTWLPGFYRTFATREHALLCQCRERRVLALGAWPEAETGLWYGFFRPERIRSLQWGQVTIGAIKRPGLAVEHLPETSPNPAPGLRKRRTVETLYIACADEATARRILADLSVEAAALLPLPEEVPA